MSLKSPKDPVNVIERCTGLNIVHDPLISLEDLQNITTDLAVSMDVVISDSLKVELGPGYSNRLSPALTNGHSLFCDGGDCLVCQGTSLYQVATDYTLTGIRSGMSGAQVDYDQYGLAIYYTNGTQNGVFQDGISWAWNVDSYDGPVTTKYWEESVPVFEHIASFNGYMLGSIGNALYVAELGKPGLYCAADAHIFAGKIVLIRPVETGVFISDSKETFFASGLVPAEWTFLRKSTYPAIEWSSFHSLIDSQDFAGVPGQSAIWISTKGLCLGTSTGEVINLTRKKIIIPDGFSQGATLVQGFNVISTLR